MLVRYGLVAYDGKAVIIDWLRLCAFAAINTKLMGQKKSWNIAPMNLNLLGEPKTQVHTYIGTGDQYSKWVYAVYEATQQAIADGVKFPELEGSEIASKLLGHTKTGVHNYIGNENLIYTPEGFKESVGWYSPFGDPDPEWVHQQAVIDAYGEIVTYIHYNMQLPF